MAPPLPDSAGHFGAYGGRFIPETLMAPVEELARAYDKISQQRRFKKRLAELLADYVGRPSPLYFADRLTRRLGGARIYLKREDLLHTGAHKINNAVGQALLAREMGKTRVIAETGAGQHGVATATAAALLGLQCVVYMGEEDMRRQRLNVDRGAIEIRELRLERRDLFLLRPKLPFELLVIASRDLGIGQRLRVALAALLGNAGSGSCHREQATDDGSEPVLQNARHAKSLEKSINLEPRWPAGNCPRSADACRTALRAGRTAAPRHSPSGCSAQFRASTGRCPDPSAGLCRRRAESP